MKNPILETKHRQMLELLAEGASTRTIAKKMGYSDGTVRVYLHNLYKKLGVKNRTEALLWQLERTRPAAPVAAEAPTRAPRAHESFGDAALRDGLLGALGVMESFLGPYGRVWEIGAQLKGTVLDAETLARRDDARLLWRALLQGAFSHAKALHDEGHDAAWFDESTPQALMHTAMLLLGGYTHAGDRCLAALAKRKGARTPSARELALLRSLREAMYSMADSGLNALQNAANEGGGNPAVRQMALVLLFHACRARKDPEKAREVGDAIWLEAEDARRQLEAMGIRPLARETVSRGRTVQRRAGRAKATAS